MASPTAPLRRSTRCSPQPLRWGRTSRPPGSEQTRRMRPSSLRCVVDHMSGLVSVPHPTCGPKSRFSSALTCTHAVLHCRTTSMKAPAQPVDVRTWPATGRRDASRSGRRSGAHVHCNIKFLYDRTIFPRVRNEPATLWTHQVLQAASLRGSIGGWIAALQCCRPIKGPAKFTEALIRACGGDRNLGIGREVEG